MELAGLFLQIGQDLHQGLLFGGHQLSHEQAGQDAVLLGHVTFHAETPGLFATHDDGFRFHQGSDEFEPHRGLVNGHSQQLGHRIDLMAGGNRAHHRTGPAAVLLQVIQGQGQHLVRGDPSAVAIHDAKAVGVSVEA